MTSDGANYREELTHVLISGLAFPLHHRKYLINLVRDIVRRDKAQFITVAGHAIEGKALEKELRERIRFEKAELRKKREAAKKRPGYNPKAFEFDEESFHAEFIQEHALAFDDFLSKTEGAKYHFVISEKVFDRPLGASILKGTRALRNDIRLIGERVDGTFDPEVKIPLRLQGVEPMRVIVPRNAPWHYRIITSFMQRLINSFVPRTFSPKPSLIEVGCTGTSTFLPFHEGVPSISAPTLHKIDEQRSTENMVGCTVVKMIITKVAGEESPRLRIIKRTYDFRPVVAMERQLSIPQDATKLERMVLQALSQSPASPSTIVFRVNTAKRPRNGRPVKIDPDKVKEVLKKLIEKGIVQYRKYSNHYVISEQYRQGVKVTLEDLLAETKVVEYALTSCFHGGALKTLYHTALKYLPGRIWHADVWVDNGDQIQGLAHRYEYNGESLPSYNGSDKQEVLTSAIRGKNILDIFQIRLGALSPKEKEKLTVEEIIRKCLIKYVFEIGNHPSWGHHNKQALILWIFESELKNRLTAGILEICEKESLHAHYQIVRNIVEEHVIRVGETKLVNVDGTLFGVKHPFKGRTLSKSHRIQDAVDFIWRVLQILARLVVKTAKKTAKSFSFTHVANFHEAAAVHVVKFNETILGVMTGAYLKDTQFETNNDKVVDFGHALATTCLNRDGRLVYSEVEFDNYIHPEDERIVFADRIRTSDVLALCAELNKIVDLPWR